MWRANFAIVGVSAWLGCQLLAQSAHPFDINIGILNLGAAGWNFGNGLKGLLLEVFGDD